MRVRGLVLIIMVVLVAYLVGCAVGNAWAAPRDYVASAKRATVRLNEHRACFNLPAKRPTITTANARAVWIDACRRCKALRYRMVHPKWQALGAQAWRPLVRHAFRRQGIGWREGEAILVINRESGGNPTCQTGPHYGLFQFNAGLWGVSAATAMDPWWAVMRTARAVREQGGWCPAWAATAP